MLLTNLNLTPRPLTQKQSESTRQITLDHVEPWLRKDVARGLSARDLHVAPRVTVAETLGAIPLTPAQWGPEVVPWIDICAVGSRELREAVNELRGCEWPVGCVLGDTGTWWMVWDWDGLTGIVGE